MCILSLAFYAPMFGWKAVHYFSAVLVSKGGDNYRDRLLSVEACMEVGQYEYNLITHELKSINMGIQDDDNDEGMKGFDGIAAPFKSILISADPIDFGDIGSQASRQAASKNKVKSAMSLKPKIHKKAAVDANTGKEEEKEGQNDKTEESVCFSMEKNPLLQLSYKEMKGQLKVGLKKLLRSVSQLMI
eukprot:15329815-Ditylum_brightwellii.AAC.1